MKALTIILALGLTTAAAAAQDAALFRFTQPSGPHPVGFKVVEKIDHSRVFRHATDPVGKPFAGERARPLQMLVWYPAAKSSGDHMTVEDYLDTWATQTSFAAPQRSTREDQWRQGMRATFDTPLWAVRNAPEAQGRFPVVIYSTAFSRATFENADLCEYLASHGFVVIGVPSLGAMTRQMTLDVSGANAQARDISFAIDYAQTLPNTDPSHLAVTGYSWGSFSSVFAAARDARIDALVSLDGSLRYYPKILQQAGDVRPQDIKVPLLYFAQGEITLEEAERDLDLAGVPNTLNAWGGDLLTIHMLGMTHEHFSAMSQRNELDWHDEFPIYRKADFDRADATIGYGWMARYALWFLNAQLKSDPNAQAELRKTPADNGVPKHFLSIITRPAAMDRPSFDTFRAEVGRQGFKRAGDVYAAFRKRAPAFLLDEITLAAWADELLHTGHVPEAIDVLAFRTQTYPTSSAAHAALGDAYVVAGQKRAAFDSYRKALDLAPVHRPTTRKLEALSR